MAKTRKAEMANRQEAAALREHAGLPDDVKLESVTAVIERCGGDWDLAMTALTMKPRPQWVSELLGLHPERPVGS
jgi:hypothetical protein